MPTEARRPDPDDGLVIVGIVGRTGSGKSTVAQALAEDGAVVIDADRLGHQVTDHDPRVRRELIEEYGDDIYLPGGSLDRRRVAERVFRDPAARARLDRLVHPRILELIERQVEELRSGGHRGVVVIDAALMLDWNLERSVDAVIAVTAGEPDRIERLSSARGLSEAEAKSRLAVQRSEDEFVRRADLTLDNRGSRDELIRAARAAVAALAQASLARRAAQGGSC